MLNQNKVVLVKKEGKVLACTQTRSRYRYHNTPITIFGFRDKVHAEVVRKYTGGNEFVITKSSVGKRINDTSEYILRATKPRLSLDTAIITCSSSETYFKFMSHINNVNCAIVHDIIIDKVKIDFIIDKKNEQYDDIDDNIIKGNLTKLFMFGAE